MSLYYLRDLDHYLECICALNPQVHMLNFNLQCENVRSESFGPALINVFRTHIREMLPGTNHLLLYKDTIRRDHPWSIKWYLSRETESSKTLRLDVPMFKTEIKTLCSL